MARSDNNQFYSTYNQHDFGIISLGAAGTASVRTPLSFVRAGLANYRSGAVVAGSLSVSNISAGVVTITDSAGAANADAVVSYNLIGLP